MTGLSRWGRRRTGRLGHGRAAPEDDDVAADSRVQRVGKARTPATHFDVGFSRYGTYGRGYIGHRSAIDKMHGVAERHAERDAHYREEKARARPARIEQQRKAGHRPTIPASAVGLARHGLAN